MFALEQPEILETPLSSGDEVRLKSHQHLKFLIPLPQFREPVRGVRPAYFLILQRSGEGSEGRVVVTDKLTEEVLDEI